MFVVRATLKDETRRVVFEDRAFPSFGEIQQKVSMTSLLDPVFCISNRVEKWPRVLQETDGVADDIVFCYLIRSTISP